MGSFSTIGGGGITKLSELIIDANPDLAPTVGALAHLFEQNDVGDVAEFIDLLNEDALLAKCIDHSNLSVAKAASIFDNANLSAAKAASIADDANLTAAKAASIFDNANLSAAKAASIADNANLTEAKLQAILDNTNLTIQKGQEIVDAMSSPSKIGTGGRRGIIGDDWEDNKLASRDNAATVATALGKIYQSFRPEWTVEAGTVTAEGGNMKLTTEDAKVSCSSSVVTATFKSNQKSDNCGSSNMGILWDFICKDDSNEYTVYFQFESAEGSDDDFQLRKTVGGSESVIINSLWTVDLNWHEIKVTRDTSGNFELFLDGVSKGTVTDTDVTTSSYIKYREWGTAITCYVNDLEVF